MSRDLNFDHLKSLFHTCFLSLFPLFSLSLSLCVSLPTLHSSPFRRVCPCKSHNHRIMSSSSSRGEARSLLQFTAPLIWIPFKSTAPFIVEFPWKVTLSLKPISIRSFKNTFALCKDGERRDSVGGADYFIEMKFFNMSAVIWSKPLRCRIQIFHFSPEIK